MSCPVASVNRALCVLAAAWMLIPVGRPAAEVKAGREEPVALQQAYESARTEHLEAAPAEPVDPCNLGPSRAFLAPLCLAITPSTRKRPPRVVAGR